MSQLALPLDPTSEAPERIPREHRVYVNRNLRLEQIAWVGFDMDYTLAIYRHPEMDRLAIEATVRKLVERGHPESLLAMPYRSDFPIRGLHVDTKLGNVLKMDRYRYVKRAFHGTRELDKAERRALYHQKPVKAGSSRFHWVDTLYTLPEVAVYAAAIDHLEGVARETGGPEPDYGALWDDVRACIDVAHQDGSIIDTIAADPARFIVRDPQLAPTLHKLRSAGKKLFVLTNSRPAYTQRVLSYLLDDGLPEYKSFRSYFDAIVCTAKKPAFFVEKGHHIVPVEPGTPPPDHGFVPGRLYEGGSLDALDALLGVPSDQVLYVGDHIFGDVLRAKKETAWRTCLILQELTEEMAVRERIADEVTRWDALEDLTENLVDEVRHHKQRIEALERALASGEGDHTALASARALHRRALSRARTRLEEAALEDERLEEAVSHAYHPFWGSLFGAGSEISSFGEQVARYACLYTARVSNLLHYSPVHYFRGPRDRMPHDLP